MEPRKDRVARKKLSHKIRQNGGRPMRTQVPWALPEASIVIVVVILFAGAVSVAAISGSQAQSKAGSGGAGNHDGASGQESAGGGQRKANQKDRAEKLEPPDAADSSEYIGYETCKGCHEDEGRSFEKGPHLKTILDKRNDPRWRGCEACHGAGRAHAEAGDPALIVRFEELTPAEAASRCIACHSSIKKDNPLHSQHGNGSASCLDCHSSHAAAVPLHLLKKPKLKLCSRCHLDAQP